MHIFQIIFQVKDQQEAEKKKVASMEIQATIEVSHWAETSMAFNRRRENISFYSDVLCPTSIFVWCGPWFYISFNSFVSLIIC